MGGRKGRLLLARRTSQQEFFLLKVSSLLSEAPFDIGSQQIDHNGSIQCYPLCVGVRVRRVCGSVRRLFCRANKISSSGPTFVVGFYVALGGTFALGVFDGGWR
jgi:hypothetical protein